MSSAEIPGHQDIEGSTGNAIEMTEVSVFHLTCPLILNVYGLQTPSTGVGDHLRTHQAVLSWVSEFERPAAQC